MTPVPIVNTKRLDVVMVGVNRLRVNVEKSKPTGPRAPFESAPSKSLKFSNTKGKASATRMGATYDNDGSYGRLGSLNAEVASLSGDDCSWIWTDWMWLGY
ncbi:unnamed protein product [Dovyalis caffra]|uniref:Uncharacterized protein n=1 Tax=Dovyalis caffra TaxID=77055 RepID=A0AAV1R4B8_9ROSI|nr:unnamed protein product [Dovyalis caffra]